MATLTSATVADTKVLLAFDETIASIADVAVSVGGGPVTVGSAGVSGSTAELTLASAPAAEDAVFVDARVSDGEGNETRLVGNGVTNLAAAA